MSGIDWDGARDLPEPAQAGQLVVGRGPDEAMHVAGGVVVLHIHARENRALRVADEVDLPAPVAARTWPMDEASCAALE